MGPAEPAAAQTPSGGTAPSAVSPASARTPPPAGTPLPRTGVGVDVHPFSDDGRPPGPGAGARCPPFSDDGRTLGLAGLAWPGERGLAGHSDGDVAAHAACDAL